MIDAINVAAQTVAVNSSVLFGATRIKTGCTVRHENDSGKFTILKPGIYKVGYNGNVLVPTGETLAPVSLQLYQDGELISGTKVTYTPAALDTVGTVAATALIKVLPCCACSDISLRNVGTTNISITDANIVITREC